MGADVMLQVSLLKEESDSIQLSLYIHSRSIIIIKGMMQC